MLATARSRGPGDERAPVACANADDRLQALRTACELLNVPALSARLEGYLAQVSATRLDVAVVGQFNAGKSSLLNALVGEDVLPVSAVPATCVPTYLLAGVDLAARLHTADGEISRIPIEEVATYVTEEGNPRNRRGIAKLEITDPGLADLPNLVLVDTPGLGSGDQWVSLADSPWLNLCGAALVAVSATQPLTTADLDIIDELARQTPHVVVVVTKVDLLQSHDRAAVVDYVTRRLREHSIRPVPVLPHSTARADGDLCRDVRDLLNAWQGKHADTLNATLAHRLDALTDDCRRHLQVANAAANATEAARRRLVDQLAAEAIRAGAERASVRTALRPYADRAEELCVRTVAGHTGLLTRTVVTEVGAAARAWHGTLAQETATFRAWLEAALKGHLAVVAAQLPARLEAIFTEAREPLDRLAQAQAQRLAGRVRDALGVEMAPTAVRPDQPGPPLVDIQLDRVFDSHLELLSWLVPMPLVRGAVHHHFVEVAEREAQTNALRIAYGAAAQAREAIDRLGEAYLTAMRATADSYLALVRSAPDTQSDLECLLKSLER